MSTTVLLLPGIGNSGPQHWQSIWERSHREFVRVQQRDWDYPVCEEWVAAIAEVVKYAGPAVVLLGCLAVAHWVATSHSPIKAALLVAVPDAKAPTFPTEASGFFETPFQPFSFPSTVVVSDDDPYGSLEHSEQLAAAWGSRVVRNGSYGHINASSGPGAWLEGYELLNQLRS